MIHPPDQCLPIIWAPEDRCDGHAGFNSRQAWGSNPVLLRVPILKSEFSAGHSASHQSSDDVENSVECDDDFIHERRDVSLMRVPNGCIETRC